MTSQETPRLRADAERNRARIVAAAEEVFAERGLDAPVAEIARRAGVGAGTLFRRFPTKDDLVVAIFEQRVERFREYVEEALADPDPWHGFASVLERSASDMLRDRGLKQAVGQMDEAPTALHACHDDFHCSMGRLLEHAQAAGAVRADLTAEDMPFIMHAISGAATAAGEDAWRRYVTMILDGLRATAPAPG